MILQLRQAFLKNGYRLIQTSMTEITGFCKEMGAFGYCICMIDDRNGFLNAAGKKDYVIRQMQVFLREKTGVTYQCLGVIVTDQAERTKTYTEGTENYWLVDVQSGRLLVYEDQPAVFADARRCIEDVVYTEYGIGRQADVGRIPYGRNNPYPYTGSYRRTDQNRNSSRVKAFHLTPVNTCLLAVNIVVFLILELLGNTESAGFIYHWGGMTIESVLEGHEYWRLLTCAFLHFGVSHLFSNMLVLAFVGDNLERALGSVKYLVFYILSAIGSSFISCLWMFLQGDHYVVSAGASGAIFAVLGGIFYVLIKNHGRKDDLSTVKVGLFLAFSILQGFTSVTTNNSAHISGLFFGVILAAVLYQRD